MATFLRPDSVFASDWGTGTAAVGPTPIMETYARVLRVQGVEPILASAPAANGAEVPAGLTACQIESGFVVAERIAAYRSLSRDMG